MKPRERWWKTSWQSIFNLFRFNRLFDFYNFVFLLGNFSRLTVNFRFERQIGHHLIQTFAPSTLVVMLSWFSFWLGLDAIPGRVTLLVTCMLTLVTMFTGLRADIPPVAYVKVNSIPLNRIVHSVWPRQTLSVCTSIKLDFVFLLFCFLLYFFFCFVLFDVFPRFEGIGSLDGWLHDICFRRIGWIRSG